MVYFFFKLKFMKTRNKTFVGTYSSRSWSRKGYRTNVAITLMVVETFFFGTDVGSFYTLNPDKIAAYMSSGVSFAVLYTKVQFQLYKEAIHCLIILLTHNGIRTGSCL